MGAAGERGERKARHVAVPSGRKLEPCDTSRSSWPSEGSSAGSPGPRPVGAKSERPCASEPPATRAARASTATQMRHCVFSGGWPSAVLSCSIVIVKARPLKRCAIAGLEPVALFDCFHCPITSRPASTGSPGSTRKEKRYQTSVP